MRTEDAERAKRDAAARVVETHLANGAGARKLEALLNDTLYHEQRRLERESSRDPVVRADRAFYRELRRGLGRSDAGELQRLLERTTSRFAEEIAGHFNQHVYNVATTLIPAGLSLLLRATTPGQLTSWSGLVGALRE